MSQVAEISTGIEVEDEHFTTDNEVSNHGEVSSIDELKPLVKICNERKNSIKKQMVTALIMEEEAKKAYVFNKYSDKIAEFRARTIHQKYQERLKQVSIVLDEFKFIAPDTIVSGCKERGNIRICKYGYSDSYRNAIWIHTHGLEELTMEFPRQLPLQKDAKEYEKMVNELYRKIRFL